MQINRFEESNLLEKTLAEKIAEDLQSAIDRDGQAFLLVSGGSTPIKLYNKLSQHKISWNKVSIALVDERFVPPSDENSNGKMIHENLCINHASEANFVGMVFDPVDYDSNLILAKEKNSPFLKNTNTVCILGMGEDGHTASLFPNDAESCRDLVNESNIKSLINTFSPVEPKKRITFNKAAILASKNCYLLLFGEKKLQVFIDSSKMELPISYFSKATNFQTFYSPSK